MKKKFSFGKLFLWAFFIALAGGIIYGAFFFGAVFGAGPAEASYSIENPLIELMEKYAAGGIEINQDEVNSQAELEFDEEYINYALFAMGAWKLHNPLLSGDAPKIRVVLDSTDKYYSEVIKGVITSYQGNIENPDIAITSTKKELIQAMLAEDMTEFMQDSVESGRTGIELIASMVKLASKGYLQMYEDATGKSLIGSIIRR